MAFFYIQYKLYEWITNLAKTCYNYLSEMFNKKKAIMDNYLAKECINKCK